jgi:protein ImuB
MYAVLHLPDFFLQALLRTEPALRERAVALVDGGGRQLTVIACTDAARRAGIELGQTAPQALARCSDVVVRTRRADLEEEAAAALLAASFGVAPQVEATGAGVCTIEIAHLAPARRLPAVRLALRELESLGLLASAGTASTPLLALYAARQAEVGTVLEADRSFLQPLPLAVAEPAPELSHVLASWGVKTLGQLTALAKADVTHRLGRAGLALWERAAGGSPRPLHPVAPAREFAASLECEHELETLEPLLFVLRRFVDRLALDLRNAHYAALALDLTLDLADESQHCHHIRLPEAVTDAGLLFRALHTYLETVRTTAAIRGVRLKVIHGRGGVRQQGLFDGGLRDPHGFADTLARVMALVGADRVGRPVPANTHRPDTVTLAPPPPTLAPLSQRFAHPPTGLPLRRHRPPTPATIELVDARPAYVLTPDLNSPVREVAGPWRSSGDWWETGQLWQREEWDVELTTGGVYRLLHTPGGWFVEGEYD